MSSKGMAQRDQSAVAAAANDGDDEEMP